MKRALTKHLMTTGMAKNGAISDSSTTLPARLRFAVQYRQRTLTQPNRAFCRHPTYNSFFSEEQSTMDWVKDDTVKNCMRCNVPFTALRRKHHCRVLFVCFGDDPRFARRCSATPALPSVFRSMVPWSESVRTATPRKRVCM